MAKIRTLTQLQETLDMEMSWRIKEISDFKLVARKQSVTAHTFTRAGVALVYAHWEGFIKGASDAYLNFVNNQGHIYRDLKTCFAVFGLKGSLVSLTTSRRSTLNIDAFDFIVAELDKPARMTMSSAIDTESNLTSKVFANIATSLNISISNYETKFNLIDESLVRRRNRVAHGEYLDLTSADFLALSEDVLQLMRAYKTDIENAATLRKYMRSESTPAEEIVAPA